MFTQHSALMDPAEQTTIETSMHDMLEHMMVFITEKTSFCDFSEVYAHSEQVGLKFTWQTYLQHLTLRSTRQTMVD
jgi:hypothetical protein